MRLVTRLSRSTRRVIVRHALPSWRNTANLIQEALNGPTDLPPPGFPRQYAAMRPLLARLPGTTPKDLRDYLVEAAEACQAGLEADRVSIWLKDQSQQLFELNASFEAGRTARPAWTTLSAEDTQDLIATLAAGEVLVADQAATAPHLQGLFARNPGLQSTCSRLDAPILIEGEVAGVLIVSMVRRAVRWSAAQIHFAREIAGLITLGVERRARLRIESELQSANTRLLAEIQRRDGSDRIAVERQRLLADLIRAANHPHRAPEDVALEITDVLRRELAVDRVALWRRGSKAVFQPYAVSDSDPTVQPTAITDATAMTPAYVTAMLKGEPLVAKHVDEAPHLTEVLEQLPLARLAKSRMDIPIIRDGRLDAEIICSTRHVSRTFSREDGMFATAVGAVISILLERAERLAFERQLIDVNTRLVEEADLKDETDRTLKRRQGLLAALIREAGSESGNERDALQTITEQVRLELGIDRVAVYLFNGDQDCVAVPAIVADDAPQASPAGTDRRIAVSPSYLAALAEGEPLLDCSGSAFDLIDQMLVDPAGNATSTSRIDLPLVRDGRLTGVVVGAARSRRRQWSREDALFGAAIASVIAVVLERRDRQRFASELLAANAQLRIENERRDASHSTMKLNQDILSTLVREASDASRSVAVTYDVLVAKMRVALRCDMVSLWLGTVDQPTTTIAAVNAVVDTGPIRAGLAVPTPAAPDYYDALAHGEPLAAADAPAARHLATLARIFPAMTHERSRIDVPIMRDGKLVGMLVASTTRAIRTWSQEDLLFCSAIAGVASILIEREHRQQIEAELRAANAEVVAANRAKSLFLANMSHEIRTPMNGVFGMTDLLLRTDLTTRQTRLVETISQSARTLLTIINDILDLSRIEAGKMELDRQDLDLHSVVQGAVELLAEEAQKKKLDLSLLIDPSVPRGIVGDAARLRQICLNLIGNAVKFTTKGSVAVRVTTPDATAARPRVIIEVRDTGIGIPPDLKARLFQPFAQGDSTITRRFGGTGLGLSISMHLATLMGGRMDLDSTPGVGTTVRFEMDAERAESQAFGRAAAIDLSGHRVLVVDDRETNRAIVSSYLLAAGARPVAVADADAALAALEDADAAVSPFSAIVVDMVMPGIDGLSLVQAVRADPRNAAVGIVMLTSLSWKGDQRSVRRLGVQSFLTKPVRRDELVESLGRAIELRGNTETGDGQDRAQTLKPPAQFAGRVLIAEDNPVNVEVAREHLAQFGLDCDVAGDGARAVAMIEAHKYDLVLMDCQMPDVDGFEATRRIRLSEAAHGGRRLPIVALTANAYDADRVACLDAGMDDFVPKPFTEATLAAALSRWLPSAPAKPAPARPAALDQARIDALRSGRATMLPRITASFMAHTPGLIEKLCEAAATGNAAALQLAAHSLKSSSATVGATRLAALCQELENLARGGDQHDTTKTAHEIAEEFRAVGVALEQELKRAS